MAPRTYRFGEFELHESLFELRRAGVRVDLQPKSVDLLLYLLRHRDRVVPKDELLSQLWPDVAVSDASLSKAVSAIRKAIGDDRGQQSHIETIRRRGFRFVSAVDEIDGPTEAANRGVAWAGGVHSPENDFVGRADILAAIATAVAEAHRGAGRLVLLTGEVGMGKTRIGQEAAAHCRSHGGQALLSWCTDGEGMPTLWPWLHLLEQLAGQHDLRSLSAGLLAGLAELAALSPAIRKLLGDLPARSSVEPEQARFRQFDTITQLLARAAKKAALLLILDDFHWADHASLALLHFLAREISATSLCVLIIGREENLHEDHPLLDLTRRPGCAVLSLTGLSRAEVAQLVGHELGAAASPAFVDAIYERTEGNPFFVKELVRALAAQGPADGAAAVITLSPLPAGIHEVLRLRLGRLSAATAAALAAAAVIGRDFDLGTLADVLGLPATTLLLQLDEAGALGLIRGGGTSRSFVHALVRDALLERLPAAQRSGLHRRVGEVFEARHADDLDPHLGELAYHFCVSAVGGDIDRAVAYARRAGDQAVRLFAADEAATHYQRALTVQGLHVAPDRRVRAELLLTLGEAQMMSGRAQEGRATLRQAAALARSIAAADLLARAALGLGGLELSTDPGVHDPELIALLEEALATLPHVDSTLRVRLLVRLALALCWVPALERTAELVAEAVDSARRLHDPAALAHALYMHRWSLIGPRDLEARLADSDEMLALASQAGERELELGARSCRFLDLIELGRLPEADRELAVYARLAEQLRVPRYRWRARFYRTMRVLLEGRFAEAEELALHAVTDAQRYQLEGAANVFAVQLLVLRHAQGRITDLESMLRSFVDRSPAVPAWRAALPFLHAELGQFADARDTFEAFAADEFRALPRDVFWVSAMVFLAEACCLLEDAPRAATLYEHLRPFAPRTVMIGVGVACWGALDRSLGALATTAGYWDLAAQHLEDALQMNTRIGARPWVGWTHFDFARLRAQEGDPEQARAHLARAQELATALGMLRLEERAGHLARHLT